MAERESMEDRIVAAMRRHFLKYTDEVVEKYKDQIDSAVKWYVSSLPRHVAKSESDDLSSEAKMAFVEALKTWDPRRGDLWPYISIRLKGAMQDYLRKRGSDPVTGIYEWVTQAAHVYMAFNPKAIVHEELPEGLEIESAMRDFPEREKKILEDYYKKGKTFLQIGEELGLSESQVSRICKSATEKLKKALTKEK